MAEPTVCSMYDLVRGKDARIGPHGIVQVFQDRDTIVVWPVMKDISEKINLRELDRLYEEVMLHHLHASGL